MFVSGTRAAAVAASPNPSQLALRNPLKDGAPRISHSWESARRMTTAARRRSRSKAPPATGPEDFLPSIPWQKIPDPPFDPGRRPCRTLDRMAGLDLYNTGCYTYTWNALKAADGGVCGYSKTSRLRGSPER